MKRGAIDRRNGLVGMCRIMFVLGASLLLNAAGTGAEQQQPPHRPPDWRQRYLRPAVIPYPAENPWSETKAALGAALFFDPILSGSQTTACVTCHRPAQAWADNRSRPTGDRHEPMILRSQTLLDVAWVPSLGWDGEFGNIEAVSFKAISGGANMDLPVPEALRRLSGIDDYVRRFEAAFGAGPITRAKVEQALATYERGIVSAQAPFDRWIEGDDQAMTDAAKRGFAVFEGKGQCIACHSGWAFTDYSFHDVGRATGDDIGRARLFPSSLSLRYAFKVPTLRDVATRAPYMHDGSLPTLAAVVDHYDQGGIDRPSRSPHVRPLGLSTEEKAGLVAFLETLTGSPRLRPTSELARARQMSTDAR